MLKPSLAFVALLLAGSASSAATCESISAQIDAKIRAAGVQHYTLTTMDAGAKANGKVVGSCDLGTKKIVYALGDVPAHTPAVGSSSGAPSAPAGPGQEVILTECKDGYVVSGGNCKKK
jgi:hypothetical protein